jgi:ABC-type multidrug transport system ATPase subunit
MAAIIQVNQLSKQYGDFRAVNDLSFTVNEGDVYGFLGQNGAGKSTTIRMLLTLIAPNEGEIEIFGMNLRKNRIAILKKTGAIIEKPDLYKYMTALENMKIFATMSGFKSTTSKLMDQLEKVGLAERANSKVKTFSQGMKQRLGIAVSLVNDPDLVILDEPLNGLDPQGIADIRNLIRHLSKDLGKTIFISSHLLSEMEQVADSLLIIHKGKKIVEGEIQELLNPESTEVEIETDSAPQLAELLKKTVWGQAIKKITDHRILLNMRREDIPLLIKETASLSIPVYSIRNRHSLEDYFLTLTAK